MRARAVRDDAQWESAEREGPDFVHEFAAIWQALPNIVFSPTLTSVQGNARLASGSLEDELAALERDVAVGGAGLAAQAIRRGLVDDYPLFVSPVILGGGTPCFPPLAERVDLEPRETRTVGANVVYLRFARAA